MKRAFGHSFGTWHSAFGIFDWNLFQVIRNSCTITNSMDAALFEKRMDSPAASQFRGKRVHFIGVGGSGMEVYDVNGDGLNDVVTVLAAPRPFVAGA